MGLIPAHAGKTRRASAVVRAGAGSSPLTRGKLCTLQGPVQTGGLIPAHAGKTLTRPLISRPAGAHPRSRGENTDATSSAIAGSGSSPLTRGKHRVRTPEAGEDRLIPAHAGKTLGEGDVALAPGAHPRSRGENAITDTGHGLGVGSSPLTRGKLTSPDEQLIKLGLIPAHAGKTRSARSRRACPGAHPRSRGENISRPPLASWKAGSSPLTRGKRPPGAISRESVRLIPAHAGKTDTGGVSTYGHGAHPRSRGENRRDTARSRPDQGSSPLTRGKRPPGPVSRESVRLIPAHAGKTPCPSSLTRWPVAHPRSRGENRVIGQGYSGAWGSSPLTRGKPPLSWLRTAWRGLIPAHAGKTRT